MTLHVSWSGPPVVAGADPADPRTISGIAVPWDVPGRVADGTTVVFHPGSLDAAARPVALRDHDRTRPIGVVTDARDTGVALTAAIRVSRTTSGDEALILAGDGALPALSVGAEPTEWDYDPDGTLHVHAADWLELSLLTLGAYTDARVSTVTAGGPMQTMTDTPDTDPDEDTPPPSPPDEDPPEVVPDVETEAVTVPIAAGRARPGGGRHPYAGVGIAQVASLICAARGSSTTRRDLQRVLTSPGSRMPVLEAALMDVTLVGTDNVGAAYRPAYQAELVDLISHGTPALNAISSGTLQRGDYPNKTILTWTKTPEVALQTAEKTAIHSAPVAIAPTSIPVKTWAGGNDFSAQLLDLGHPSFVEMYVRAAGADYANQTDLYAVTGLLAVATDVPATAGANLVEVIAGLYGGLAANALTVPAGDLFVLIAPDVAAGAAALVGGDNAPVFWDGRISLNGMLPDVSMGGLVVLSDPNMPPATALMGTRSAATWYTTPGVPYQLDVWNPSLLGRDIAVYGYGALGISYPDALVKTTVPAGP